MHKSLNLKKIIDNSKINRKFLLLRINLNNNFEIKYGRECVILKFLINTLNVGLYI